MAKDERPFLLPIQKLFKVGRKRQPTKKKLLAELAVSNDLTKSCEKVGISTGAHYYWLETDPKYAEAIELVTKMQNSVLKAQIWNLVTVGHNRPVTYKGEITGYYREIDSDLLKTELKARLPEYRDGTNINLLTQGPQSITFVSGRERPELLCTQPQGTNSVKSIPPPTLDTKPTSK